MRNERLDFTPADIQQPGLMVVPNVKTVFGRK